MLAYRIEGIIGESLCKDENDRNAVVSYYEQRHFFSLSYMICMDNG